MSDSHVVQQSELFAERSLCEAEAKQQGLPIEGYRVAPLAMASPEVPGDLLPRIAEKYIVDALLHCRIRRLCRRARLWMPSSTCRASVACVSQRDG